MILATYQPKIVDFSKRKVGEVQETLESHLGFTPIWCFAANNWEEFLTNSILAAPNWPECLYIFESKDAVPIDVVRWNQALYKQKQGDCNWVDDFGEVFRVNDSKYCEYVVKEIPNTLIMDKANLHDCIYSTNYRAAGGDDALNVQYSEVINMAAERAFAFVEGTLKHSTVDGDNRLEAKKMLSLRCEKLAFELYLASFIVGFNLPSPDVGDIFSFHSDLYFNNISKLSQLLTSNYNGENMPTYERQDDILNLIKSFFVPYAPWGQRKIGPNECCPCGSGKKYKKCCRGKYYEN